MSNQTVTALNISNNDIRRELLNNLAQVLKSNKVLTRLDMDCIATVKPKDVVNLINSCKVYNRTCLPPSSWRYSK